MNGIGAPGMTLAQRAAHKDLKNAYVLLRAGSTIKPRPSVFNNPIAKGEYAAELTAEIEALKHAMTRIGMPRGQFVAHQAMLNAVEGLRAKLSD
ncbi:MAG: hypothetical protein AAFY60_07215 [Myxococcota bacterium]